MIPAAALPPGEEEKEIALLLKYALELLDKNEEMAGRATSIEAQGMFKSALEKMKPLPKRIDEILKAGGPGWHATTELERRFLAIIQKEIDTFFKSLTSSLPQREYHQFRYGKEDCLRALNSLAGDIDYLVGQYKQGDPLPRVLLRSAARCCCRAKPPRFAPEELISKMMELYHAAEDPCRHTTQLGISGSSSIAEKPHDATKAGDRLLVGIERPVSELLRWLTTGSDQSLGIMSIVGPAGVGKTTLAMEVGHRLGGYQTKGHYSFEKRTSGEVSRSEIVSFLSSIYRQITNDSTTMPKESMEVELLALLIWKHLENKRYFILIDDIWHASVWNAIEHVFPNNDNRGRILVTTRVGSVGRTCCCNPNSLVYEMKPLNESDSRELLITRGISGSSVELANPSDNLSRIHELILRSCEGIPLFITGYGDWLQGMPHVDYFFEEDLKQLEWCGWPPLLKQFEPALSRTYMDLPAELKLLLQYMVMLPRGHMFEKDWLVMKWVNEGLTHTSYPGDIIMDEFMMLKMWFDRKSEAEVYFSELVDRNIITRAAPNWQHNLDEAEPCQWKVNHCMLQFLASISSRTHFVVTGAVLGGSLWGAEEDAPLLDYFDIPRRDYSTNAERGIEFIMPDVRCIGLSFENELIRSRGDLVETKEMAKKKQEEIAQKKQGTKDMVITRPPLIAYPAPENWIPRRLALHGRVTTDALRRYDWSTIRSLAVSGEQQINLLDCFTYLVVLDLEQWDDLKDEDILQICNSKMYALRHLSIRNTQVSKLPPQIKELYSLMTLDVSHTHINELPSEVFQLQFLIKLDLTSTKIGKVPKLIAGLQNLQFLLIGGDGTAAMLTEGIRLPDKIVKLATVNLSDCSMGFVKALDYTNCLSVLAITCSSYQCTDKVYQEALLSLIEKLRVLRSLTIHCQLGCSMEFLEIEPSIFLQKLKVETGRFVSVPRWINGLHELAFLQITVCKLEQGNLEILWGLPKLKSLVLGLEFIPREQIAFECEGFHELMEFSVDCPVPWLTFRHGAMPKLTYLQLKFCSGPDRGYNVPSGICNLRMITEVVLCYNEKWCANSSSVKRTVEAVKKEVAKHHNPINLVINGTRHDVPEFNELEMPSD